MMSQNLHVKFRSMAYNSLVCHIKLLRSTCNLSQKTVQMHMCEFVLCCVLENLLN